MLSEEVWAHSCGSSRGVSLRSRLRERGRSESAEHTRVWHVRGGSRPGGRVVFCNLRARDDREAECVVCDFKRQDS